MTYRILGRAAAVTFAVAVAFALLGSTALAVQPPIAPALVYRSGFGLQDPAMTIRPWTPLGTPSTAYWGILPQRGRSGSYGLWCAGTPVTPPTLGWPKYPVNSRGLVQVDLPQLAGYYSSRMDVSYTEPSLGGNDATALGLGWCEPGDPLVDFSLTRDVANVAASTGWPTTSRPMSAPVTDPLEHNKLNLSRSSGQLFLYWNDTEEISGQIANGQGPILDDVRVTGYKYGPVRALTASVSSGAHLTWQRPLASTFAGAVVEDRTIAYRVWRKKVAERTWTELTTTPRLANSVLSYDDPTGAVGDKYLVQAWDTGTGPGYGQPSGAVAVASGTSPAACLGLSVTGKASPGKSPTYTYRVTNIGRVAATNVVVKDGAVTIGGPVLIGVGDSVVFARAATAGTVAGQATCTQGASDYVNTEVPAVVTSRVAGATRVDTAIIASRQAFPGSFNGSGTVVITASNRWQEPLMASSLAGAAGGPLLIVKGTPPLESAVTTELARLNPNHVYIVGDTSKVDTATASAIGAATGLTPERLQGATVYDTARAVAQKTVALSPAPAGGRKLFLATDANFPDALAASSLAAALRAPILLTPTLSLSPTASATISGDVHPTEIIVCGGTGAVSDTAANSARTAAGLASFTRLGGTSRYDTADLIVRYGVAKLSLPTSAKVFVTTGTNYPDALAGGVFAATVGGRWQPMVLTAPTALSPQVTGFLADFRDIGQDSVLGGTNAVSTAAEQGVVAALP